MFFAGMLWGSSIHIATGEVRFIFSPLEAVRRALADIKTFDPSANMHPGKGKGRGLLKKQR